MCCYMYFKMYKVLMRCYASCSCGAMAINVRLVKCILLYNEPISYYYIMNLKTVICTLLYFTIPCMTYGSNLTFFMSIKSSLSLLCGTLHFQGTCTMNWSVLRNEHCLLYFQILAMNSVSNSANLRHSLREVKKVVHVYDKRQ